MGLIYQNRIVSGENKVLVDLAQHLIKPGIYFVELLVDGKMHYSEKIIVLE